MENKEQKKSIDEVSEILHCPNCPDQGWFAIETGGCDMNGENDTRCVEQVQCEFCCTTPNSVFNRTLINSHKD